MILITSQAVPQHSRTATSDTLPGSPRQTSLTYILLNELTYNSMGIAWEKHHFCLLTFYWYRTCKISCGLPISPLWIIAAQPHYDGEIVTWDPYQGVFFKIVEVCGAVWALIEKWAHQESKNWCENRDDIHLFCRINMGLALGIDMALKPDIPLILSIMGSAR